MRELNSNELICVSGGDHCGWSVAGVAVSGCLAFAGLPALGVGIAGILFSTVAATACLLQHVPAPEPSVAGGGGGGW